MVVASAVRTLQGILVGSAILAGLLAPSLRAAGKKLLIPTDPASGVTIEIESWFDA